MKNFFKKIWGDYITSAIVTVIFGILITVFHSVAIDIVCILFGLAAALIGLVGIIKYVRAPQAANRFDLLSGLVVCAVGIYIICKPSMLENLVAVAFGIIILYHGILDFQNTHFLRKANYKYWVAALVIAILTAVAGIVLIILQNQAIKSLALIVGIMLLVEGLTDIWIAVKVKKING